MKARTFTSRKRWMFWLVVVAISLIFSYYYFYLGASQHWDFSAVCVKCLQHAYIDKEEYFGFTVYEQAILSQAHGGLMSPATFSPPIPNISPTLYKEILGEHCTHVFAKGGYGRTQRSISRSYHVDGMSYEWTDWHPRVEAIEALFSLYTRVEDKDLACSTYHLIESAYSLDPEQPRRLDELKSLTKSMTDIHTPEEWGLLLETIRENVVDATGNVDLR